jgi:agmatine deiminase
LIDIPVNDCWCRDHGPIFLNGRPGTGAAGRQLVLDFDYNAWGGKYPPWDLDVLSAGRIAAKLHLRAIRPHLILEGGAIEGNGAGTILTTESCLLNPNRNARMTRGIVEEMLHVWLQARRVVWLPGHGIIGDDTDGHIDQVARFVDERRVLVAAPYSPSATEAEDLAANRQAIESARNANGQPLQAVPLPMPQPKFQDGHRLPASYCNYALVNGGVIVPVFGDDADDVALQTLQDCYPDRTVVGIDASRLIWGLGAFHCMSQQQPAITRWCASA